MKILRVAEWTVEFGGEVHTGWLPKGAAVPPPTAYSRVDLAFAVIEEGPEDFILEWRGPTRDTSGDRAYSSLEEALEDADRLFGVPHQAWANPEAPAARRG
jgi:hypothetical protein